MQTTNFYCDFSAFSNCQSNQKSVYVLGKPSYTVYKLRKEPKPCESIPHKGKTPYLEELKKEKKQERPCKNFIASNIKTMSKMSAKEPTPKIVVDEKGTTVPLKSPMELVYIKLPKFGKTPKYLERFIQEKEKEYQQRKDASGRSAQPLCKYITRDEREQLLKVKIYLFKFTKSLFLQYLCSLCPLLFFKQFRKLKLVAMKWV